MKMTSHAMLNTRRYWPNWGIISTAAVSKGVIAQWTIRFRDILQISCSTVPASTLAVTRTTIMLTTIRTETMRMVMRMAKLRESAIGSRRISGTRIWTRHHLTASATMIIIMTTMKLVVTRTTIKTIQYLRSIQATLRLSRTKAYRPHESNYWLKQTNRIVQRRKQCTRTPSKY